MTEYDLTLMSEECQTEGWGIIMPLKHLPLGWCRRNMKAISNIFSAAMYTFQNLNTGINDKV